MTSRPGIRQRSPRVSRLVHDSRRRRRPALEVLEDRVMLSTFTVNSLGDSGSGSGSAGDLRYCINQANGNNQANTIVFDSTVFATHQTIALGGSQLDLKDTGGNQTITGPAAGVTIDAGGKSRVLQVDGVTASISGLTFTHGSGGATGDLGAGINNNGGILTLTDCTVSGNSTQTRGGGFFNQNTLTLIDCMVSGNAASIGGGIDNLGSLTLTDSTVSNNAADDGGGINNNSSAAMINCTVSGNQALQAGGGLYNGGALTLTNCSVLSNTAYNGATTGAGGGIFNSTGPGITPILTNCTIANNGASHTGGGVGGDIRNYPGSNLTLNNCIVAYSQVIGGDIAGVVTGNNNLIDDATAAGGLKAANGNILSTNLLLAAPANNGGPTETVALLPGGPALGAGDPTLIPAGVTTDQRGASRTRGGTVDIGAFERGPSNIVVTTLADENNGGIDPTLGQGTSLREAIAFANVDPGGGDTITFAPGLDGTLALSHGALPMITTNVAIAGPGANVLSIDAQGNSGILSIASGADATVSGLTLAHGTAAAGTDGGAISNAGTLTLTDSTLSGDTAVKGGAIFNAGTLTVTDSTLSGNTATAGVGTNGGAIFNAGTLTLIGSTLSGNTALEGGGGVYSSGPLTLINCTLSGNSASFGGGIDDYPGTALTLADCTVSGNSAQLGGDIEGFNITLNNTIVAHGGSGGDIRGPVFGSNNLIDDAATAGGLANGVNGNLVGLDPKLGPLANNGGPTETMAPLAGSPAINAGDNSLIPAGVTTDQRGALRIKDGTVDIGAFESGPSVITVTTLADSGGAGMTLREAIDYVDNVDPIGGVTIAFAPGLQGTLALAQGMLPAIAGNVTIAGPGASVLSIDAQGQSSIFSIQVGATVAISGLTLEHGSTLANPVGAPSAGGGIANWGNLVMTDCTVTGNLGPDGGGVANYGTLSMIESTVSHNSTELNSVGGGLFNEGMMTLINSTVANNFALYGGGGLVNSGSGTLTLDDCTVAGNTVQAGPGAGIDNDGTGTVTLDNTIVASSQGSPGGDIAGKVSGSNNLIDDAATSGGLTNGVNGNLVGVDPKLGALGNNGGATQTMSLLAGSPAIGKGAIALVPLFVTTDQRGAPRINGSALDIGAVENGATTIVVTTLVDEDNGRIDPFDGAGTSLREAIAFANADSGGGDTIIFSPLLKGAIDLSLGALPTITTAMTIDGPDADVLTVDGQGKSGILSLGAGADVTVSGLTLADGSAAKGGGIFNAGGKMTLVGCTVSGNSATSGHGGGVYNGYTGSRVTGYTGGAVALTDCTLSGNSATLGGGALFNDILGTVTLTDCTVSGNTASVAAGLELLGATNTLVACTVSANTDTLTTANINFAAGVTIDTVGTLTATIVAGNTGANDLGGGGTVSGSDNLIGAGSVSGLDPNLNKVGVTEPLLGPLAWNGGPTRTMALLTGSPAIEVVGFGQTSVTTDQRGFPLDSPLADIGAFQYQGPPPTVTISGPTTGTVQVQGTFTLTAKDPTPADQNGTFAYTIDWNGDGSDIQTIQGPASLQVTHSYDATGSLTPSVTAIDQDHRSSSPAALAAPVVVTALTTATFSVAITTNSSLNLTVSNESQASTLLEDINDAGQGTWMGNAANVLVNSGVPLVDTVIDPTSPNAQVNVSGSTSLSSIFSVNNPYGGTSEQGTATIAVIIAAAVVGSGVGARAVGSALAPLGETLPILDEVGVIDGQWVWNITNTGIVATGVDAGLVSGSETIPYANTAYYAIGGSPALVVDQGTVNWSKSIMGTVTDAPTIIVNGGTLILQNNWISGNFGGSHPLIEVDGGTLILGGPDGTDGNGLGAYGSASFIDVTGTGKVIVEPGNIIDQITGNLTAQAAGTTSVQLVSSEPIASPGDTITLTANVTAGGAAATDGSVEFFDNTTGAFLGFVAVSNGSAAIQATFNALTAVDTIYATYLPTTGALAPSSGQITQVVAAATQTVVTGPASTPVFGQSVTFTATVTDTTTGGGPPIGTVEFFDGTTDLGPGTPLNGSGSTATSTISTTSLTAGSHTIEAVFTPSSSFQGGSGFLSQVVNQASPTITWPSPTDIVFGTALSGTQLDAEATNPENGESVDGTFNYDPGQGTVLSAGSDQTLDVTFTPSDTTDYASPVAFSTSINVTKHSTMTTLAASMPEGAPGQTVTFTATVVGGLPAPYLPTGSVQFQVNGANVGSPVPLSATDTAVFSTTEPAAGAFKVTAIYSGDTDFSGSPSPAFTEAVLTPGVFAVGSTLFVVGANTSDNALLLPWGSKLDGSTGLLVLADLNHSVVAKTFAQTFTAIDVFGYGGNDNILLFPTLALPTTVSEGNGNNLIVLANGQDTVTLGSGNNQVSGGAGNKTITVADTTRTSTSIALGNGNNVISLGAGNDRVVLGKGNDRVTAGNGNDAVFASGNGVDVVALGNGNDGVHLGDGSDTVTLGDGNDEVAAGNGNDDVTVGNGNDLISLGNGSDVIVEGNGNDNASAGNGADLVVAGLGRHTILLGNGNDILIDGSATVVNSGDSLRQILTAWNANQSTSVNTRLKVVYNTSHPNVLKAGSGRNWWFYTYSKDVTSKKSSDRLN